jgi:DNA-binding CsgD family transcriptional regulator
LWEALTSGHWSTVDWFDSDPRRYVPAVPTPPDVKNPRGLTKRESQVVACAAIGEHHKLIAYRLGISRSRVTNHLGSAMRKLGVDTQAQLVERMRAAPCGTRTDDV